MSSWWRKYTELLGITPSGKSWRQQGMKATGLLRDDLAQIGSGGWDRRVVTHFDRLPGSAPWARHLVEGEVVTVVGWNDASFWNDDATWDDYGTN